MNLQEKLRKAEIDCYRMAHLYDNRIHYEEEIYSPWDEELPDYDIVNPYIASQYGLICEYYMKGILLPVLTVTNPENNPQLKQIIDNLSDEEKYRLIIGDNDIERELSKKYNLSLKEIKKLSGESIKNIGHSLEKLSKKILEKAQNGAFNTDEKNRTLMQLFQNNILEFSFLDQYVSDSFIKGRYGFLDETEINVFTLNKAVGTLRDTVLHFTKGFDIVLWEEDKKINDRHTLDHKRFFGSDTKKIYIMRNQKIYRVYSWNGEVLIPEYGLENEVDEEIGLYGSATSYHGKSSYPNDLRKITEIVTDENGARLETIDNPYAILDDLEDSNVASDGYNPKNSILVNRGDVIYISSEKDRDYFVETFFGKIAIASDTPYKVCKKTIDSYEGTVQKNNKNKRSIKYCIERRITRKLIDSNNSLSKKFKKNVDGKESMEEQLAPMRYGFGRPTFTEFRKAYMKYAKSTIQYRLAKGREIFYHIFEKSGKQIDAKGKEDEYGDK